MKNKKISSFPIIIGMIIYFIVFVFFVYEYNFEDLINLPGTLSWAIRRAISESPGVLIVVLVFTVVYSLALLISFDIARFRSKKFKEGYKEVKYLPFYIVWGFIGSGIVLFITITVDGWKLLLCGGILSIMLSANSFRLLKYYNQSQFPQDKKSGGK